MKRGWLLFKALEAFRLVNNLVFGGVFSSDFTLKEGTSGTTLS
jgi:hypothetical protein